MQTTGFLILNTISNICTFITLALVLVILYYINEERSEYKNIKDKKKNIQNRIETEEIYPVKTKKKCISPPFIRRYNVKNNINRVVTEESIEEEDLTYKNMVQNTFTPPFQETLTFVPENKNMGDNKINTYLSNCS
tara:strand:- start:1161 stop:1568 length:408 start_codon:yes stop_codon:yes gene_type:complete